MDPLGNVPLFLSALRQVDPARHHRIIVRELLIALAVMVGFLFVGRYLLHVRGVSSAALIAAGGVILLLIALRMIVPDSQRYLREEVEGEPARWPVWLGAVTVAWLATAVILYLASDLRKLLGERGLTALERLMGMVLVIVAVEMLMQGIARFLRLSGG